MDINEYIDSGILELYVYGSLTEKESEEVSALLVQYPEVTKEVEEIEVALQKLATGVAPYNPEALLKSIKEKLRSNSKVVTMPTKASKVTSIVMYVSIAASLALLVGVFSLLQKNKDLERQIQVVEAEQSFMETKIEDARQDLENTKELLAIYRDRDITKIPLAGQQVAPEAYVDVFWDKETGKAYIDAQGLPEPPPGKVYQVWSLKLNPLTPTSIGLLDEFSQDENKIFVLENPNDSQAFGITLEPAGGSESPTLEQLYTLGVIES